MSKYAPLWEHLKGQTDPTLKLTFDEIASILGFCIDHSFLNAKKESESACNYKVGKISLKEKTIIFTRL